MAEGVIELHAQSIEGNKEVIELEQTVCLNMGGLLEENRTLIMEHLEEGIDRQSKLVGLPAKSLVGTPCEVETVQDVQRSWLMGATFRNGLYDSSHPAVVRDKEYLIESYQRFLDNGGGYLDLDDFLRKRD